MDRSYDPSFLAMLKLSFPQRVEVGRCGGLSGLSVFRCAAEVFRDQGGLQELHLENAQFL